MPCSEIAGPLRQIVLDRRKRVGLSRMDLATALGFGTAEVIRMMELGIRKFPLNKISLLAAALDLDGARLARMALEEQLPDLAALIWPGGE
jgi:cyanate lyase